jgi:hypothetical protein
MVQFRTLVERRLCHKAHLRRLATQLPRGTAEQISVSGALLGDDPLLQRVQPKAIGAKRVGQQRRHARWERVGVQKLADCSTRLDELLRFVQQQLPDSIEHSRKGLARHLSVQGRDVGGYDVTVVFVILAQQCQFLRLRQRHCVRGSLVSHRLILVHGL